ncbi:MAG: hypothetical protein HY866_17755 [Chloroflexi bacterium]|nr:hypothetical protein [Chloroflexota bacterium]
MFKKISLMLTVFALMFVFAAPNVFADDTETEGCVPIYDEDTDSYITAYFCDGRLNAFDMTEPIAIYYNYGTGQAIDDNGYPYTVEVVDSISIWAIDGDGVGQPVLNVPASQITPALSATSDVQIASGNGVTLNYSPSADAFWVTAWTGYSFAWSAW